MLTFLEEVCLLPWETFEFAAVEWVADDGHAIRCNHIYVGCQRPFVIAATSCDLRGVEQFGIVILNDPQVMQRFTHGPHPPHNRPEVSTLHQLVGSSSESYLAGRKMPVFSSPSAAVCEPREAMMRSLIIEGSALRIRVHADDVVPMALLVSW